MNYALCPRCGDASGERHLCVPPFLDRALVTTNASTPPGARYGAHVPYIAQLEAENTRLRAGLESLRQAHQAEDQDYSYFCPRARGGAICWCGADEHNARIDTLLAGVAPLTAENARLRALIARYADVIGDEAADVLPGVPF